MAQIIQLCRKYQFAWAFASASLEITGFAREWK